MINIPTITESHLLKRIAELESDLLQLKSEYAARKRRCRKLENENSRLRSMTGVCVRNSKKNNCINNYRAGMTGSQLASVSKCSVRYANQVIAAISEK